MQQDHHKHNEPEANSPEGAYFGQVVLLICLTVATAIIAENVNDFLAAASFSPIIGVASVALIIVLFIIFTYKTGLRVLDTPYFAVSVLLSIAIATAAGTFITQQATDLAFINRYGEWGSKVFRFLQVDHLFQSWWYVSLFVLLILSLIKMSIRKPFNLGNLGFYMAHLSPILILCGFWMDHFSGFRGIIQLEIGQQDNVVKIYEGNTNRLSGTKALDFAIKLDDFEFEKFDPDYRIQVWRLEASAQDGPLPADHTQLDQTPKIVASFPIEKDEIQHIYGTDLYFRLLEFYPNFEFEYSYKANPDTIPPRNPGVLLKLKTVVGDNFLQLRTIPENRNKIADPGLGGSLEFYWELPTEIQDFIRNPEMSSNSLSNRLILEGSNRILYSIINGAVNTEDLKAGKYYPGLVNDSVGFTLEYIFPDAAYLSADPATRNTNLENPVARVEIWDAKWKASQDAYLYPSGGRRGGTFIISGSPYILALESLKDKETKYWKSTLSVIEEAGGIRKQQAIKVNEPMMYKGYRFYQTDFDPNNPQYSGIGVSHEPGLAVIYFGFFVLVAGTFVMFFMKKETSGIKTSNKSQL